MNIHGVLVPIVTPFTANGEVDTQTLTELVNVFVEKGVTGIVACGTTGEYYTFSPAEREQVLSTIADAAKGKITLIADLGLTQAVISAQIIVALYFGDISTVEPTAYRLDRFR